MTGVVDNSEAIAVLLGSEQDEDVFWYTELLDRSKNTGGNNRYRILRAFRHHSGEQLLEQMPAIRKLCDLTGVRAYTRLSARSYKAVGAYLVRRTVESALDGHWKSMANLYASACGLTSIHDKKLWLYDVDEVTEETETLGRHLGVTGTLVAELPSRKGLHYIARPHDTRGEPRPHAVQLHKDNPTNLYIPAEATR
jgi:hypothetical protein